VHGIGRMQANLGQRGEDLVGWASGHLDRGGGNVHVLTIEALYGQIGEAKFVEDPPPLPCFRSSGTIPWPVMESKNASLPEVVTAYGECASTSAAATRP
jgi:hypothetical protein